MFKEENSIDKTYRYSLQKQSANFITGCFNFFIVKNELIENNQGEI